MEKLLVEPGLKWFEHKFPDEPTEFEPLKDLGKVNTYRDTGKQLFEQDAANYKKYREKNKRSDESWLKQVQITGTISDKINANTIQVTDSAVHTVVCVDNLIGSVKLSKKRECMLAIDALKSLFTTVLLPPRPLRSFHQHPFAYLEQLTDEKQKNKRLLLWYFESLIKAKFNNFIKALQQVFQDNLSVTKYKVASTLFDLVSGGLSEQQKIILEVVINKLGDPDHQVSSKIIYLVKNYLQNNPKIKLDVILEIERLVSRQNINPRAQYYGFCCLSQIILGRHDVEAANRLLLIYFAFFKKFTKTKEVDSRMLGVLLTGVNRAYKFAKMNNEDIDANLNTLFKLVHVTPFNISLQALMLLNQVVDSREDILNRYYNALYRRMFALEWQSTAKETFFLNLLFNSINRDDSIPRLKAFMKRLLQICTAQQTPFVCGSFMLISELIKSKKGLIQLDGASILSNNTNSQVKKYDKDEDDEEERFVDAKTQSDEESEEENDTTASKKKPNGGGSWMHKNNANFKRHEAYDYTERNPLYAGAEKTLTYELLPFTRHYHPTVVVFANKLLDNEPVEYTGDPMEDFSLVHFLDRFVFKNPKKTKNDKPAKKSVFEPVKSSANPKAGLKGLPINSKDYLNLDPEKIPVEERVFYDYYKSQQDKNGIREDVESLAGSISDSEFDDFLFKTEADGVDANDEDDLDFADEISKSKDKKKKKKKGSEDDEDDDDDDLFSEGDEEYDRAMAEEMGDDFDDLDDEDQEMNDEDGEFGIIQKAKTKKSGKADLGDLFAAAEDFTDLINESSKYDQLGVGSISNKDKANPKQLQWEMKRNQDFKKRKSGGGSRGNGGGGGKKKSFEKKSKIGKIKSNKSKKQRK